MATDTPAKDSWDPALYTRFERERTRPAIDLLAQVPLSDAGVVVDLGCGPGNSTELLAHRFAEAETTGVDTSEAMLNAARARLPNCRFVQGDIASWQPETPLDVIYANAALQWVPDHPALVPQLFGLLAPGGVLAFQVPDNRDEPSHRLMREVAAAGPWAATLSNAGGRLGVLPPAAYYDLLAPVAAEISVWRTIYHHALDGAGAIVDWVRSTGLQPFLRPLDPAQQADFLRNYEAAIAEAYPVRADGKRLLLFPRLFVVARRPS
jgi:trans-aconitate 2-methyltransferase